jgi:chemotaxis protein MotB
MAKRKLGGGDESHNEMAGMMRWLLTYADLITLLLIVFIVLYSVARQDVSKFRELAQYLRAAFGGVLQQGPTFLQGQGDRIIPDLVTRMSRQVESVAGGGMGASARVFQNERGIVVRLMTDNVLFDLGSASVKQETQAILDAIAPTMRDSGLPILVEGHTDDLPIRGGPYLSNWELSTARASAVVRYLISKGSLPAKRLAAAGYAEYHPVVPNTSSANRRRNRRIDIVILEGQKTSSAGEAPAVK